MRHGLNIGQFITRLRRIFPLLYPLPVAVYRVIGVVICVAGIGFTIAGIVKVAT